VYYPHCLVKKSVSVSSLSSQVRIYFKKKAYFLLPWFMVIVLLAMVTF